MKSLILNLIRFRREMFVKCYVSRILLASLLFAGGVTRTIADAVTPVKQVIIITVGPRALRDATRLLGQQLGCVITYEDPQFESAEAIDELYPGGSVIPLAHGLQFSYDPSKGNSKLEIIKALLNKYQYRDDTVIFQVADNGKTSDIYDVYPIQIKDSKGQLVLRRPLLNAPVTLSENGDGIRVLEHICALLSANEGAPKVEAWPTPYEQNFSVRASISVINQTVRYCLDELLQEYNNKAILSSGAVGGKWSWALDTQPGRGENKLGRFCVLSFYYTPPPKTLFSHTVSMQLEAGRPLYVASTIFAEQYKSTIIYEDAPWACDCEVLRDKSGSLEVLRGGILTYSFDAAASQIQTLTDCVNTYQYSQSSKFSVRKLGQGFYLYPVQVMHPNEQLQQITQPVLDTKISLSVTKKMPAQILAMLCQILTNRVGLPVVLGKLPMTPNFSRLLSYSATNKAANLCLLELTKQIGNELSWQLLFNPHQGQYVLSASPLGQPLNEKEAILTRE